MIYTEDDFDNINALRKSIWIKISLTTALFIIAIVLSSIYRLEWLGYTVGILWGIIVVFLWGMQGSRIRKYYLFLKDMRLGLEKNTTGQVVSIDSSITSRDLVDFYTIVFNDDNANPESPSRKLYFDAAKGLPEFKENDKLNITLFGNNIKEFRKI